MGTPSEIALEGGRQTEGIVRVADTVRRPLHARSGYVHAVLRHLEAVGFDGAPRLRGIDDEGREILGYVSGAVIAGSPVRLSDERAIAAGALVRRFHDATAGTALAAGDEVVCHGDLGPHNIVFRGDQAIAIIDWDDDVAPGGRLCDLAHLAWCCADVCDGEVPVREQARTVALVSHAYGWHDTASVLDEIADRFRRARDQHGVCGRPRAAEIFDGMAGWMRLHGPELRAAADTVRAWRQRSATS